MASVLTSACCCDPTVTTHHHAAHLPTHRQLVVENRLEVPPLSQKALPRRRHRAELTPRVEYAGCSLPGTACGAMIAIECMTRGRVTRRRVYTVEWATNVQDADKLRPDGHNPCNGDETFAIATATYITGLCHLTLTTATTSTHGRTIGMRCPNNAPIPNLSSARTQHTHIT